MTQTTHQYYYRKGKVTAKAVIYTVLSAVMVLFAAYSYLHWEMSFLFSEWQGWVILIFYSVMTLGIILSAIDNFKKMSMTRRGIPAFAVGDDHFVIYDHGLANVIPFEDCDRVRFKSTYSRISGTQLQLIIKHHDKAQASSTFEVKLSELDQPQSVIDKQLKKIYNNYKRAQ